MTRRVNSAEQLRSQLKDIGEGLAVAFVTLSIDPNPASGELLAIRLRGAVKHLQQLAEAQSRQTAEGGGDGR